MAIDYGDARIGLAVSDPTGTICGDAWTMEEWNMERAAARIAEEAAARGAETLVLGLPKNMDGTEGPRAEKAEPSRLCWKQLPLSRSSSGMSGAAASRHMPFSMLTGEKRENIARQWMPLLPA